MAHTTPKRLFLSAALLLFVGIGVVLWIACAPLTTRTAALTHAQPAPDFNLPTHTGETVQLATLLNDGPVVIVFYRGHW
jgi:cytochrome oxidase Cu insertion factor (SCO1/SenC/PrrC family)